MKMRRLHGALLSAAGALAGSLSLGSAWAQEPPETVRAPREVQPEAPAGPATDPEDAAQQPQAEPAEPAADPSWQVDGGSRDSAEPPAAEPPVKPTFELPNSAELEDEPSGPPRYMLPEPTENPYQPTDYEAVPFTHHQLRYDLQLGYRLSRIGSRGFDPYSENDLFGQVSASVGRGILREGRFSLAALGVWEFGSTKANVRTESASYSAHRLSLALEGRYHLLHWLYGYGRLAPGALRTSVRLDDSAMPFGYEGNTWVVSADAALGGAVRLLGDPDGRNFGGRLWVFVEAGYGWSAAQDVRLLPTSGAPERAEARSLGELSLAGPYGRAGLNLTF